MLDMSVGYGSIILVRKENQTMTLQQFQTTFSTIIKKGQFTKAKWQSAKQVNGVEYKKVSQGVVRFVQYAHIKGVQPQGKANPNDNAIIPSALYHNANTGSWLVQMATTNVRAKCKYFVNGNEVDKATFEQGVPPRQSAPTTIFRVKLENLLEVGNA